jgi:DNA-binding IclR family transcriptional regulator
MLRVLDAVRRRGYGVALDPATRHRLREVAKQLAEGDRAVLRHELAELLRAVAEEEYATVDLDHDFSHEVTAISAPVFGPDGTVVLVVGLMGFPHRLSGAQIPPYAVRLLEVTRAVTRAVHGRPPVAEQAG